MTLALRLWISALAVAALAVVGGGILYFSGDRDARAADEIGGPFTLVNGDGETVTEEKFDGQYKLVYFGYTYCPDVCPTSLLTVTRALNGLEKQAPEKANSITPIFITVDPERDTPEVVGDYVTNFHERMVGLTGSDAQIAEAAKQYRVRYWRVKGKDQTAYTMAHSAYTFLMGPDGEYIGRFDHKATAKQVQEMLAERISG